MQQAYQINRSLLSMQDHSNTFLKHRNIQKIISDKIHYIYMYVFLWPKWTILQQCLKTFLNQKWSSYASIIWLVGWLVVFYVPSTVRWFRDGTSIYCPLPRTWSSIFTLFLPGIEPRAVEWQSISLPLRHANFPSIICCANQMNHGTITIHYGNSQKKGALVIDWLIHYSAFSTAKAM